MRNVKLKIKESIGYTSSMDCYNKKTEYSMSIYSRKYLIPTLDSNSTPWFTSRYIDIKYEI